jgi:hypothetical protein
METIEEAAKNYAENELKNRGSKNDKLICMIDFSAGANWMLDRLQDFDTWKEWKDMYHKQETIVTEYRDGNIKVETFKSK